MLCLIPVSAHCIVTAHLVCCSAFEIQRKLKYPELTAEVIAVVRACRPIPSNRLFPRPEVCPVPVQV